LASGYLITGGLHLDGLMDTFDGIFAGKKKRLKAMKDSKVGAFGVQALVFITLIQIACILKIQNLIIFVLPICLFWGRFSNLFFIGKFKYMSYKKKSISHKKFWNGFKKESMISIIFLINNCGISQTNAIDIAMKAGFLHVNLIISCVNS